MRKKDGKVGNKTVRKKIQIESQKKNKQTNPNFVLCKCAKNKKLLNYIQLEEKRFKKKDLVQNAVFPLWLADGKGLVSNINRPFAQ